MGTCVFLELFQKVGRSASPQDGHGFVKIKGSLSRRAVRLLTAQVVARYALLENVPKGLSAKGVGVVVAVMNVSSRSCRLFLLPTAATFFPSALSESRRTQDQPLPTKTSRDE